MVLIFNGFLRFSALTGPAVEYFAALATPASARGKSAYASGFRSSRAGQRKMAMSQKDQAGAARDILANLPLAALAFWFPVAAIVATGFSGTGNLVRTIVWTAAAAVMGATCLVNALRCGRMHCYFTGPFFLVMAAASLLYGTGLLPLGARGWSDIGLVLLTGGVLLTCVPELVLGKYRPRG